VVEAVSTAASAVSEFAQAALPMVAGIAAGVLTTAGCLAVTGGAGSAGCVVAGFAAGSAVTSALSCPPGRSIVGCAARGGAAGAVGGAVFVATGGMGSGMTAAIVSGAASNGASSAAAQYLDTGEIDGRLVAFDAAVGGVTGAFGARGKGRRSPSGQSGAGHPPTRPGGGAHPSGGNPTAGGAARPEFEITADEWLARENYSPHNDPNLVTETGDPAVYPPDYDSPFAPSPMGPTGGSKGRRLVAGLIKAFDNADKWLF